VVADDVTVRLDAIEAYCAAATEGPWSAADEHGLLGADATPAWCVSRMDDDGGYMGDVAYMPQGHREEEADAAFIAAARTDLPAVVAALRDALRWKAEALTVFDGWEDLYLALGAPGRLGEMKSEGVRSEVERIRTERDALAAENARLRAQVQAVEALHQPMRIYDECEHDHPEDWPGWIDTGEFLTCAAAYLHSVCRTCCVENTKYPEQASWCADGHDHRSEDAHACPTRAALATTEAGEES
jgi:hypothetical protein